MYKMLAESIGDRKPLHYPSDARQPYLKTSGFSGRYDRNVNAPTGNPCRRGQSPLGERYY
jgi:hypothetical protein